MDDAALREMARDCYGYGRWSAPYWFIGPEQGQGRDDLCRRFEVWKKLNQDGLCDCREFHHGIDEVKWHRNTRPPLQRTWDKLIILLMTFKEQPTGKTEHRRAYQRNEWAMTHGETCVIELSGLAAHDLNVDRGTWRVDFLDQRIKVIRKRIEENVPKFVVMYGAAQNAAWREIAGRELAFGQVVEFNGTAFVMAAHPVSNQGVSNNYWSGLGVQIRKHVRHL
jgi:hypothetical protein